MSPTGSEFFTTALEQYDVTHFFGNPGTTELPLMDALSDSDLEYVLGLHEDVAVGLASGYAKARRWHAFEDPSINPIGIVNLHVAPGVAHGLGNLFDSSLLGTGAPLLVTAGLHSTGHQHREPNLYGDLVRMTDQFTKWSAEVKDVDAFPGMLRRAIRTALTPPTGPVFLALPFDVMTAETDAEPERLGSIPTAGAGDATDIERAADAVVEASDPVMIVGDRLARAGTDAVDAAVRLAEATGMRVHGEFRLSEAAFPTDHDQWAGGFPDDRDVSTGLMEADAIVFAGIISNMPTLEKDRPVPDFSGTTSIHISDHTKELGKNYVTDIGIIGDMTQVMDALADQVIGRVPEEERERRLDAVADVKRRRESDADDTGDDSDLPYASNAQLADAVATAAPDARVVAEATTSTGALRDRYDFDPGHFLSFRGGGLGYGLPASIGMAIAESQRDDPQNVIGFLGDGSYLFYPNAVYSAVRHDVDVTIVVADNRNYRVLKDNMLSITGRAEEDHEFVGMDFDPPLDIPKIAEGHGASSRLVDDPAAIQGAVEDALAESGPTVLDVLIHD